MAMAQLYLMPVMRNMSIGDRKRRGRPIYITSGSATISLVPEISLRQWSMGVGRRRSLALRILRPFAIYVISAEGVHRLNVRDARMRFKAVMLATALLAPLPLRV